MICPKCGHENLAEAEDCARCGVIFARIKPELIPQGPVPLFEHEDSLGRSSFAAHSTEDSHAGGSQSQCWGRAVLLLGMIVWGGSLIFAGIGENSAGQSVLHLINLPFHESGHVFFRPFGQFITSLGGTLAQLLVPLICLVTLLLKTSDPFGAAVCGWWFGENFLDIAPYIGDARAGQLPMVGGNFGHSSPYGFHDWEYLLTETGLLRFDQTLAKLSHGLGALLMMAAIVWAGILVYRQLKGNVHR